jgi:hypothetical protein
MLIDLPLLDPRTKALPPRPLLLLKGRWRDLQTGSRPKFFLSPAKSACRQQIPSQRRPNPLLSPNGRNLSPAVKTLRDNRKSREKHQKSGWFFQLLQPWAADAWFL